MNNQNNTDGLDGFDVLDWITSGTVARKTVTIYNNPALADEMDKLQREYEAAVIAEADAGDERELAERRRSDELLEQMKDLYSRWEASKAEWTVEALTPEVINEITDLVPNPPPPAEPKRPVPPKDESKSGNPEKRAAYKTAMEHHRQDVAAYEVAHAEWAEGPYAEWLRACKKVADERNLYLIAAAVIEVRTPKGTGSSVSVEALRAWKTKPHGKTHLNRLINAVNEITTNDVVVPAPKSLRLSEGSPD